MENMNEEEKWQFCPDKECFYCNKNIESKCKYLEEVISVCPYCGHSYVD